MSDNGMGGRRIGKKSHEPFDLSNTDVFQRLDKNFEESTDYFSIPAGHGRLSEIEQLIADYNRQNQFIRAQKRKWLPPRKRK